MRPVFGASNVRDSFGLILDTLFWVKKADSRSGLLALDELITGDRYLFVREAYVQRRGCLVTDGQVEEDFGDF